MPLTKRRKERFVKALRSNDYTQTYGQMFVPIVNWHLPSHHEDFGKLTGEVRHCAIGVLVADEIGKEFNPYTSDGMAAWIKRFGNRHRFYHSHVSQYDYYATFGLTQYEADKIMNFNDREKWSFSRIADWVEENIKTK